MHPIKARGAIREAWERHGVRDFVLDSADELAKIRAEVAATGVPGPLGLVVRIALPKGGAKLDLSGKFGADADAAVALLRAARACAAMLGVSFHVGSQCLDPLAWRDALALTGEVIAAAGVEVDVIDVGGGFPVAYPDQEPPPMGAFFAEIEAGFDRLRRAWRAAVGGAWPCVGRCGDVGGGAGAGAARRGAVCQRWRVWEPGGCRDPRVSLSGAADPSGRRGRGRNGRVLPVRADL